MILDASRPVFVSLLFRTTRLLLDLVFGGDQPWIRGSNHDILCVEVAFSFWQKNKKYFLHDGAHY